MTAATPGQAAEPRACDVDIWDGPYRMNCALTLVGGKCITHGDSTMRRWRAAQDVKPAAELVTAMTPAQAAYEAAPLGWIGHGVWPAAPWSRLEPEDRRFWQLTGSAAANAAHPALAAEIESLRGQVLALTARSEALRGQVLEMLPCFREYAGGAWTATVDRDVIGNWRSRAEAAVTVPPEALPGTGCACYRGPNPHAHDADEDGDCLVCGCGLHESPEPKEGDQ